MPPNFPVPLPYQAANPVQQAALRASSPDTNSSLDAVGRVKFQEIQAKSFMSNARVEIPYGF